MRNITGAATPPHPQPFWTGDPPPSSSPNWAIPALSIQEQMGVDPTSKLADAITRLAAAIERLADREDER